MIKLVYIFVLISVLWAPAREVNGLEYNKKEIKHGMYEDIVNETFGSPRMSRDLDPGFLPIPRKRSLYELDEGDYMVLQFYSGRVSSITILSDVEYDDARAIYEEGL